MSINISSSIPYLNRRDFLYGMTSSLGSLAMTDLLAQDTASGSGLKKPMHEPKAKNVIMLFMKQQYFLIDSILF